MGRRGGKPPHTPQSAVQAGSPTAPQPQDVPALFRRLAHLESLATSILAESAAIRGILAELLPTQSNTGTVIGTTRRVAVENTPAPTTSAVPLPQQPSQPAEPEAIRQPCAVCSTVMPSVRKLKVHMREAHNIFWNGRDPQLPSKHPETPSSTTEAASLRQNSDDAADRQVACADCSRVFVSRRSLRSHKQREHKGDGNASQSPPRGAPLAQPVARPEAQPPVQSQAPATEHGIVNIHIKLPKPRSAQ